MIFQNVNDVWVRVLSVSKRETRVKVSLHTFNFKFKQILHKSMGILFAILTLKCLYTAYLPVYKAVVLRAMLLSAEWSTHERNKIK